MIFNKQCIYREIPFSYESFCIDCYYYHYDYKDNHFGQKDNFLDSENDGDIL